jgi:hypothetical protein
MSDHFGCEKFIDLSGRVTYRGGQDKRDASKGRLSSCLHIADSSCKCTTGR